MRQPFLRHVAEDEDFLAAYLGYDNIIDLHRLQFSEGCLSNFFQPPLRADPLEEYMAIQLIFELTAIDRSKRQPPYHDGMYELQVSLHDKKSPRASMPPGSRSLGAYLWETAIFAPNDFNAKISGWDPLRGQTKDIFTNYYMPNMHGKTTIVDLPNFGPIVKPPTFNNSGNIERPDIESCLRIAALMHSIPHVTKLNVWRRKWPWTVKEKTQEQIDAENLQCAKCGKTDSEAGKELKRCAKCQETRYCSRECQKANWKGHKQVCAAFRKAR